MTLMLSLPLLPYLTIGLHQSTGSIQDGFALLFLMFSLSAIILSTITDVCGAHLVLKYAQSISILGLILLSTSFSYTQFLMGCFCLGAGTGCYASISRALISKHATSPAAIKKGFSYISILIVIAPFLSSLLVFIFTKISWHIVYGVMATIEILLMVYAQTILRHDHFEQTKTTLFGFLLGYLYCLKQPVYLLNMLTLGITFAIYMQIFAANLATLSANHLDIDQQFFFLISLGLTLCYIIGIFIFKSLSQKLHPILARLICILVFIIGLLIVLFDPNPAQIIIGIFIFAGGVGFLVPLSTSSGMLVIKKNFGSAAALFTFSFACVSAIWSFVQAHIHANILHFIQLSLTISSVLVLISVMALWWHKQHTT